MTRFAVPLGLVLLLAACGQAAPTASPASLSPRPSPSTPAPSPAPVATPGAATGVAARGAYIDAICPIFLTILELDPRLATLRAEGVAAADPTVHAAEIKAVGGELRSVLNDLAAVPDWAPGQLLRIELMEALHEIRVAVLDLNNDLDAADASERMAGIPYIASRSMDRAMGQAADAGLNCDEF